MKRIGVCFLTMFVAFSALQGCVSVRSSHGYILERGESDLDANVGLDTKESVLAKYGEPSMIGTFDPDAWYYLAAIDQSRAFFRPRTQAREVVAIKFDGEGVVEDVKKYDLEDGLDIKMVSRVTRTRGKELSFWEQLLGNVGQLPTTAQQSGPPR